MQKRHVTVSHYANTPVFQHSKIETFKNFLQPYHYLFIVYSSVSLRFGIYSWDTTLYRSILQGDDMFTYFFSR